VSAALLLHLPKLFVKTAVSGSAFVLGCWLVVATVQAAEREQPFLIYC
jgi:hypothetical protein